ncbi:hypothetical protein FOA52_003084 [Chlamydomonas sp. UWO 241]|nr:hypothetical protein FOA52_003084 [Chlamydomonas sp. UWO 241]
MGSPAPVPARGLFIKQAIAALELRGGNTEGSEQLRELAAAAYAKLQFDFPIVSVAEVEALAQSFRGSVSPKQQETWLPFQITAQLVANAVAGAQRAPPPLPPPQQHVGREGEAPTAGQPGPLVPGAATAREAAGAGGGDGAPGGGGGAGSDPAADAAAAVAAAAAAATAAAATAAAAQGAFHADAAAMQGAYHQLCASLCLPFMKRLLSLAEADAAALMQRYEVGDDGGDGDGAVAAASEAAPGPLSLMEQRAAEESGIAATAEGGANGGGSASVWVEVWLEEEAEALDNDDEAYEDMEPCSLAAAPGSSGGGGGSGGGRGGAGSMGTAVGGPGSLAYAPHSHRGPCAMDLDPPCTSGDGGGRGAMGGGLDAASWSRLRSKLLHLGGHASYAVLSAPCVWAPGSHALPTLLELLRVLGVHARGPADLSPLLHAYMGLLADRLADAPSDLACMPQLWQALGVEALTHAPAAHSKRARDAPSASHVMPPEAAAAFALIASVATRLSPPGGSSYDRALLWAQLDATCVLPLAGRTLGDLAGMDPSPEGAAAAGLVAGVLAFYVAERPAHGPARDAAPARLLSCGVARALSLLIPMYPGAAGEQLRVLGLVAAGCSADVARYMLAVPAFGAWLGGHADARARGAAEAHGALWRLLAVTSAAAPPAGSSAAATAASSAGSAGIAGRSGSGGDGGVERGPGALLALLRDTKDVGRLHAALCLMQALHRASGGRFAWGRDVSACLAELGTELRARAAELGDPEERAAAGGSGGGGEAAAASSSSSATPTVGGTGMSDPPTAAAAAGLARLNLELELDDGHEHDHHGFHCKAPLDAGALSARRDARVLPECARIVKGLLTGGGKTD